LRLCPPCRGWQVLRDITTGTKRTEVSRLRHWVTGLAHQRHDRGGEIVSAWEAAMRKFVLGLGRVVVRHAPLPRSHGGGHFYPHGAPSESHLHWGQPQSGPKRPKAAQSGQARGPRGRADSGRAAGPTLPSPPPSCRPEGGRVRCESDPFPLLPLCQPRARRLMASGAVAACRPGAARPPSNIPPIAWGRRPRLGCTVSCCQALGARSR
jgi:hypothetical protein